MGRAQIQLARERAKLVELDQTIEKLDAEYKRAMEYVTNDQEWIMESWPGLCRMRKSCQELRQNPGSDAAEELAELKAIIESTERFIEERKASLRENYAWMEAVEEKQYKSETARRKTAKRIQWLEEKLRRRDAQREGQP